MIIRLPLRFEGSKGEKYLAALFDSGATYSCINEKHMDEICVLLPLRTPMRLASASTDTTLLIGHKSCLAFYHEDIRMSDEFLVVPDLREDVIIGANTMQKWRLKLDFDKDTVIVDPRVAKLILVNLIDD